ncbi:MAG: MFS transporter [Lactovum sp.]
MNKNFLLLLLGQTLSLFGNGILRFTLPLYLLKITGSASIFGMVTAFSLFPIILVLPIAGILTDRLNKKKLMITLDFLTAFILLIFVFLLNQVNFLFLLMMIMLFLYTINAFEQPAVQASLPLILDEDKLVKGNSVISGLNAISQILAPVLASFIFTIYGIYLILYTSILCFFITAILELFLEIPHPKNNSI